MPVYAVNKKARFDYDILRTVEAGLVLTGQETKGIRSGNVKLVASYVSFGHGNAYIKGMHLPKYRFAANVKDYDPERPRKLLLSKREIASLEGKSHEAGLTIVPLSLYTKGRYIKVELGVAKGKKAYDKKAKIKKRDLERELRRELKS